MLDGPVLLNANEWEIEGIVTSSSQYHWRGHRWAGDDWMKPYLDAYERVHPNLVQHDARYPTPEYLRARTVLGNVNAEGEMDLVWSTGGGTTRRPDRTTAPSRPRRRRTRGLVRGAA